MPGAPHARPEKERVPPRVEGGCACTRPNLISGFPIVGCWRLLWGTDPGLAFSSTQQPPRQRSNSPSSSSLSPSPGNLAHLPRHDIKSSFRAVLGTGGSRILSAFKPTPLLPTPAHTARSRGAPSPIITCPGSVLACSSPLLPGEKVAPNGLLDCALPLRETAKVAAPPPPKGRPQSFVRAVPGKAEEPLPFLASSAPQRGISVSKFLGGGAPS